MGAAWVWVCWWLRRCGGLLAFFFPALGQSAALADAPVGSKRLLVTYIQSLHIPCKHLPLTADWYPQAAGWGETTLGKQEKEIKRRCLDYLIAPVVTGALRRRCQPRSCTDPCDVLVGSAFHGWCMESANLLATTSD